MKQLPVKQCFKCGVIKPLSEYYTHAGMADGHLGKCKKCSRRDAIESRQKRVEYYREYDRRRFQDPERREYVLQKNAERRKRDVLKTKTRAATRRAIRSGKLVPQPCEECGSREVQAHHTDYSKPLKVRWLCFVHHRMEHGHYREVTKADAKKKRKTPKGVKVWSA